MKLQNICKFTPQTSVGASLTAVCFVQETCIETMSLPIKLACHRMILITRGEGEFIIDGDKHPFCMGNLIFAFSGEVVMLGYGKDAQYIYIDFFGAR